VEVKVYSSIALIGVLILCAACPPSRSHSVLNELQGNNMDFTNLEREYYKGITFMLSDMFGYDYDDDYVLTDEAETKAISEIDVNFSVEVFDEHEAELIQYTFDDEIDPLDAVHDNYIIKRQESLYETSSSIKKEVPKSVGYQGYIQVVHGSAYSFDTDDGSSYFTATLDINGRFFVFQLIGTKKNMGYLYDDFIDLLSSVEG